MLHIKLRYLDPYFEPSILPDKESLRKFLFEPAPRLFFVIPLPIFLSSLLVSQILPDIQSHAISFPPVRLLFRIVFQHWMLLGKLKYI